MDQWLPKLTSNDTPLNPYRVLWDLQNTVDVKNTIITHDAGSPRDQLSPFWRSITPLSYIRLGQDARSRLRPGPGDGRQDRAPGQAVHQRLGRRGDRLHRHGLRDRGARAHPHHVDPAEQLLDGDRAEGHGAVDGEVPHDRHLRRLRGDGPRLRRLWRAGDAAGGHHPGDPSAASSRTKKAIPVLLEFITSKETEASRPGT
jgi:acetolactate synthase-1/2/3 large subunit